MARSNPRTLAKCIEGPLDGMYFSIHPDQTTIEGFNDMPAGSVYNRENSTLRDFAGEEKDLVNLLFDTDAHDLKQIVEFKYNVS